MAAKEILYEARGREEFLAGVHALANAIKATLGPRGRNVVLERNFGAPRRKELLDDIAVLTGGELITEELGRSLESTTLAQLGRAQRIAIDKDTTTIAGGAGAAEAIKTRVESLERQIAAGDSEHEREQLQQRLAQLAGSACSLTPPSALTSRLGRERVLPVADAARALPTREGVRRRRDACAKGPRWKPGRLPPWPKRRFLGTR